MAVDSSLPASDALFPLELRVLDHYTLIVEDAAAVARFHEEVLGFTPLRIQKVNAGSVPEGEYDMLNHVLQIPGTKRRVMVVTEGLTEDSIFCRYMRENGAGVHHVAYEIDNLDVTMRQLHEAGIKTTSDEVLTDPLTGLRQIFIHKEHCGYFVELIERTEAADSGVFTNQNMAALAKTMVQYLKDEPADAAPLGDPIIVIHRPLDTVLDFLRDPLNLPRWTGHRTVRVINEQVVEVRLTGDVPLAVEEAVEEGDSHRLVYRWQQGDASFEIQLRVAPHSDGCEVLALLGDMPEDRRRRTVEIIQTELAVLAAIQEQREEEISDQQRSLIEAFHLEVYQRRSL